MKVLSFDPQKVRIENGIVRKQTSDKEYQQVRLAEDYLCKNPIVLDCGFRVQAAPLLNWNGNELIMKFCSGLNFEHALLMNSNRKFWLDVFKQVLEEFRKRGFLWGDIAPRNIVFDTESKIIYIFDFERNFIVNDGCVEERFFNRSFRQYAYEEFSCFLTPKEQEAFFAGLLSVDSDIWVLTTDIESGRKRKLLKWLFEIKDSYCSEEMCLVENLMSKTITPFLIGQFLFYPAFLIEEIVKMGRSPIYVEIVKEFRGCRNDVEKLAILEKFIRRFFANDKKRTNRRSVCGFREIRYLY